MSTQRESLLIAHPFKVFLIARGWHTENIHGNAFQYGLPDCYICHQQYSPRWIEFKVFDNGLIHLTTQQKIKFPLLDSMGVPIFIIAADDLRGRINKHKRERLYKKLFDEPNVHYALNKRLYSMLR